MVGHGSPRHRSTWSRTSAGTETTSATGRSWTTLTPKTGRNCDNDPALLAEPVWDPRAHPASWRAVWAYLRSRAVWDTKTLTAQENRERDVITGGTAARMPRFVKTAKNGFVLNETALARTRRLAGLKGYVTNIPATVMPPRPR